MSDGPLTPAPLPVAGKTWRDRNGDLWRWVGGAGGGVGWSSVRVGSVAEALIWPRGIPADESEASS